VLDATLTNTPTIFAPNSSARYQTVEFDATANINKFGFRGDEESLEKGQIIAIGDSFTFGFGLADESTWPTLLENYLSRRGQKTQVYNLGSPGSQTSYHADIALNYADALQPSVVILSVLLGDDFQQVHEQRLRYESSASPVARLFAPVTQELKATLIASLPGFYKLYHFFKFRTHDDSAPQDEANVVTAGWAAQATELISTRNLDLPGEVRQNALAGNINPGLLLLGDEYPDRSWKFWQDVEQADAEALHTIEELEKKIRRLNKVVESHGGQLFILSMPSGELVQSQFMMSFRDYGANIPDANLESLLPELILRDIARRSGAQFIPTLETFREHAALRPDTHLFFPIDGHLTPRGSAVIAAIVSQRLQ